jgi:propionate CoA-transferase
VDAKGNISFENEFTTVDALSIVQMTRRNHGKVIVQVDRVTSDFRRPRDVIIPAAFADAVVVSERSAEDEAMGTLSGDIHVPTSHMDYWFDRLERESAPNRKVRTDSSADIIGRRAVKELRRGDIVNIGVGIPERVCAEAANLGMLEDIVLSVESGGMGGLPAGGLNFGAMIGADIICDMSMQFDFYDGGGLDMCFMGALEMDKYGNVNAHRGADQATGIGGFGNITSATHSVVFCLTFDTKGLDVAEEDGNVVIRQEGSIPKIVDKVRSISFSGKRAVQNGQRVLYVTERCVFQLTPEGLALTEVYPGIDKQKDILDRLPFEVIDRT